MGEAVEGCGAAAARRGRGARCQNCGRPRHHHPVTITPSSSPSPCGGVQAQAERQRTLVLQGSAPIYSTAIRDLGELGPGIVLHLQMLKELGFVMLVIAVVTLPCIVLAMSVRALCLLLAAMRARASRRRRHRCRDLGWSGTWTSCTLPRWRWGTSGMRRAAVIKRARVCRSAPRHAVQCALMLPQEHRRRCIRRRDRFVGFRHEDGPGLQLFWARQFRLVVSELPAAHARGRQRNRREICDK